MWYQFFLGKSSRPWTEKEQQQAVVDLKLHMMRFDQHAASYDAQGIDTVLEKMGFHVDAEHVKGLWAHLENTQGIDVGHKMEALAKKMCQQINMEKRRVIVTRLWPTHDTNGNTTSPNAKEEAIFDRVARLLGFKDKTFLDHCVKHHVQRDWDLSESDMYCVVAELLICIMWSDGNQDLQENEQLCQVIAHGFQMEPSLIQRILIDLHALDLHTLDPSATDEQDASAEQAAPSKQAVQGLEQFDHQRQARIDVIMRIAQISKQDAEHKFHVLIDLPQFEATDLERRISLLVEKLRYNINDYGYNRLLNELKAVASVDGTFIESQNSAFAQIKALLNPG